MSFIDEDPSDPPTEMQMIDSVVAEMKRTKQLSDDTQDNEKDGELLQLSILNAKNEISHHAKRILAQVDSH